jgi:hypothetical protein
MTPPVFFAALWFKSSFEKLMSWSLILYALRHKENVAAKYSHGQFELVATGNAETKRLDRTTR